MRTTTTRHDALRPLQALLRAACFATLVFCSLIPLRAADSAGAVSGAVSNQATGNLLQGAKVEIPALGLSTLVDETGRYVLSGVSAGTHEVVVSYIGLDTVRAQVAVAAGQRATRDFDLTTGIYKMDAFKVTGEREGGALFDGYDAFATFIDEEEDEFGGWVRAGFFVVSERARTLGGGASPRT